MYSFNKKSVKRIASATKGTETKHLNSAIHQYNSSGGSGSSGKYVKLTDQNNGRYSWVGMRFDEQQNKLVEDSDYGTGDNKDEEGYAIEILNQSHDCLIGDIVMVYPVKGDVNCLGFYYDGRFALGKLELSNGYSNIGAGSIDYPTSGDVEAVLYKDNQTLSYQTSQRVTAKNAMTSEIKGNRGGTRMLYLTFMGGSWWVTGAACGGW